MSNASQAFDRLHPSVQRWVWKQEWTELRDLQERAIPAILDRDRDVILAAATASGKTEAAFLPIVSHLATEGATKPGFRVLYVSPLKALINDQFGRLTLLCTEANVPIHRWHGDVPQSRKATALKNPGGVLLITPESLEALFVRRGLEIPSLFGALEFIVVDELHAFIGSERGRQLQSLLHRIDLASRKSRQRIALSATLGDMEEAARFLRPHANRHAEIIESAGSEAELRIQLRGYINHRPETRGRQTDHEASDKRDDQQGPLHPIADHLYTRLRGHDNLVFANSRMRVEELADQLRRRCEKERVPVEFFPHHGNLSKELREFVEAGLKKDAPRTAVCTSTLELGIDIGSVDSIAQVGPPPSVASLRQRLGRSGRRRGEASVLRLYITEEALDHDSRPDEALRLNLVQSVAMVELLLERWYEPPRAAALHLSTLIQQLLSIISQHGGARAGELYDALCKHGPFTSVSSEMFAQLLRHLGKNNVLQQSAGDGSLLLAEEGERIANHYTFYAAFQTSKEYRLVYNGKSLGTLPISHVVVEGIHLVFGGRRWLVQDVLDREQRIQVIPSEAGRPPAFGGGLGPLHEKVLQRMFAEYQRPDMLIYLDSEAQAMLAEARGQFQRLDLAHRWFVSSGEQTFLFPWLGTEALNALALALIVRGQRVEISRTHLVVDVPEEELTLLLQDLSTSQPPEASLLAKHAANKLTQKHHDLLSDSLLCDDYASSSLDVGITWERLGCIARGLQPVDLFGTGAISEEALL